MSSLPTMAMSLTEETMIMLLKTSITSIMSLTIKAILVAGVDVPSSETAPPQNAALVPPSSGRR